MKDGFDALVELLLKSNMFLEEAIEVLEKGMIEGALRLHERNQSAAAKQLGIHRNTLQRKMVEYGFANGRTRVKPKPPGTAGRPRRRRPGVA